MSPSRLHLRCFCSILLIFSPFCSTCVPQLYLRVGKGAIGKGEISRKFFSFPVFFCQISANFAPVFPFLPSNYHAHLYFLFFTIFRKRKALIKEHESRKNQLPWGNGVWCRCQPFPHQSAPFADDSPAPFHSPNEFSFFRTRNRSVSSALPWNGISG